MRDVTKRGWMVEGGGGEVGGEEREVEVEEEE